MSHLDSWSIIAGHLAEVPARIAKRVCDKSIPIALSQGRIVFVVPSKLVGRPHLTLSQRKRELVTHPLRPMRGTRGGASQEPSAGAAAGRRSAGVGHSLTFPGTRRGESSLGSGGRAVFVAVLSRVWNRRLRRSLTKGQEIRGGDRLSLRLSTSFKTDCRGRQIKAGLRPEAQGGHIPYRRATLLSSACVP